MDSQRGLGVQGKGLHAGNPGLQHAQEHQPPGELYLEAHCGMVAHEKKGDLRSVKHVLQVASARRPCEGGAETGRGAGLTHAWDTSCGCGGGNRIEDKLERKRGLRRMKHLVR